MASPDHAGLAGDGIGNSRHDAHAMEFSIIKHVQL